MRACTMENGERTARTLQPIARLKATSGVSGLCFLSNKLPRSTCPRVNKENAADEERSGNDKDDESSSGSDDDDGDVPFQCRSIIHNHNNGMNAALVNPKICDLDITAFLATCHNNGPAQVWDLRHQKVVYEFGNDRRPGPGLALRRQSSSSSSSSPPGATDESSLSISSCRVLYQTRDEEGTVSLHDLVGGDNTPRGGGGTGGVSNRSTALVKIETFSQTFCAASPCVGDANLVALPSQDVSFATIRDWRIAPTDHPVAYLHGAGMMHNDDGSTMIGGGTKKHGMLTSLAMLRGGQTGDVVSSNDQQSEITSSSRPIVACGMEDGNIFFHDLAITGGGMNNNKSSIFHHSSSQFGQDHVDSCNSSIIIPHPAQAATSHLSSSSVISLSPSSSRTSTTTTTTTTTTTGTSSDPVLTLDLALSAPTTTHHHDNCLTTSFVAVAGLAGDAAGLGNVPTEEQGRIAIIKGLSSSSCQHDEKRKISLRLRARVGPNYYQNKSESNIPTTYTATGPGFAGISVCRWRPDGRIFAAGGWDKRIRIYDRASSGRSSNTNNNTKMLAVLKGHEASVTAVDWAQDAKSSGLLATGATDGSVYIWSCFGR